MAAATVQEVINYLQQFSPNDTVWMLAKNPKPTEETEEHNARREGGQGPDRQRVLQEQD